MTGKKESNFRLRRVEIWEGRCVCVWGGGRRLTKLGLFADFSGALSGLVKVVSIKRKICPAFRQKGGSS